MPSTLVTDEFVLRPITAADADRDYAAVMETREYLRLWEQTGWPEEGFTVEENREDLRDLEQRHADGRAFTYTVLDPADTACLGCVYVFHTDASFLAKSTVAPVGGDRWEDVDLVVYFWVRLSRMGVGMDQRLLAALRAWLADEWMSARTVFVTSELFAQQVAILGGSGLSLRFARGTGEAREVRRLRLSRKIDGDVNRLLPGDECAELCEPAGSGRSQDSETSGTPAVTTAPWRRRSRNGC